MTECLLKRRRWCCNLVMNQAGFWGEGGRGTSTTFESIIFHLLVYQRMSQSLGDVRFHRLGSQARYFSDKTPTAESYEGIKGYFRALNTECRSSTCNAFETIHLITQCREGKSKATDQFHTWLNARSTQSNKKHPKTQNCAGSEDVHKQGGISFAHIVAQGLLSATATAPPPPFFFDI